jgi:hypothetical protein
LNARLLSGRDGRLHLIWGESGEPPTVGPPLAGPTVRLRTLWHADFEPRTGWTPARAIHTHTGARDRLLWNSENADAAIGPGGRLHVVVPQINGSLLYFTLDADGWLTDSLPWHALYASVTEAPNGERYIAYVGEDPTRGGALDGLLVLRAGAKDGRWSFPVPVQGRGDRIVTRPRLLVDADGGLHLAWGQIAPSALVIDAMRYEHSHDGGATWSAPSTLPLPREAFTKWRLGVDDCGAPHAVVSTWSRTDSAPVGHLLHSALDRNGWTRYSDLFSGTSAREAELTSDATGALHLIASVRRSGLPHSSQVYDVVASELVSRSVAER